MDVTIFNTKTRTKEVFTPLTSGAVGIYSCGPTVYADAHIGNLRAYVTADILRRTLVYNEYKVTHVVNITDVGHLTSDADEGEDKMTKALTREGKELTLANMRELGEYYTQRFLRDIDALQILPPDELPRASDHIKEQIALIERLEAKGVTYRTSDGVYFDTSQFPRYAEFAHLDIEGMQEGARVDANTEKRNRIDFALWKFNDELGWESPWGNGFPGWHLECSAMSMKYLGEEFDIHTGGIDHIPVHHTNEIAQSETATGKPLARYWIHTAFVNLASEKMAKSEGNTLTLAVLKDHGFSPLAYRYWLLTAHYRSPVSFSWEALEGVQNALIRLHKAVLSLGTEEGTIAAGYQEAFHKYINDDLDTPQAVALLWELLKDEEIADADKLATIQDFDRVLGLSLGNPSEDLQQFLATEVPLEKLPTDIKEMIGERERARVARDFQKADELRDEIQAQGYEIEDTDTGPRVKVYAEQ